jgi:hypothetical protein
MDQAAASSSGPSSISTLVTRGLMLVLVEAAFGRYEPSFGHHPNLAVLNGPYCGNRLRLVWDFEVTHLIPAEG